MSEPTAPEPEPGVAAEVAAMKPSVVPGVIRAIGIAMAWAIVTGVVTVIAFVSPLTATLLCLAGSAMQLVARRSSRLPQGSAPVLLLPAHVSTFIGWRVQMGTEIVVSHWRCGTAMMAAILVVPVLAAMVSGVTTLVVLGGFRALPRAPLTMSRVAAATFGISLLAVTPVLVHRVITLPGPDGYVASLPRVATLATPPDSELTCEVDARSPGSSAQPGPQQRCWYDVPVENRVVRRRCSGEHCSVVVGHGEMLAKDSLSSSEWTFKKDHPLDVLHDVKHSYWLVVDSSGSGEVAAFDGAGPTDIAPVDVASSIAPPPAVAVSALAGAGAALASALVWLLRRRRAAKLLASREGTVDAMGWLTPDGDGERPVRLDQPAVEGRVIVVDVRSGDAYRAAGGARVLPTTHAEVRARLADFEDRLAVALAVALPAAMVPVVAAALSGLVF